MSRTIDDVLDMYENGETPASISSLLDIPLEIVYTIICEYEEDIEED
jgi:hypothetical protein